MKLHDLFKSTVAALALSMALNASTARAAGTPEIPPAYPLKKCPISDEKLGEHGKPAKVTSDGTDVWLCCKSCIKDFNKEPAKYVKMVADAQKGSPGSATNSR